MTVTFKSNIHSSYIPSGDDIHGIKIRTPRTLSICPKHQSIVEQFLLMAYELARTSPPLNKISKKNDDSTHIFFRLVKRKFYLISSTFAKINAFNILNVRVFILAEVHDEPNHLLANALFIHAIWGLVKCGLVCESKGQLSDVHPDIAAQSQVWDIRSDTTDECFSEMFFLTHFAQAIYHLHSSRMEEYSSHEFLTLLHPCFESILLATSLHEVERDFFPSGLLYRSKAELIKSLIDLFQTEYTFLLDYLYRAIKANRILRDESLAHTIETAAQRYPYVIAICGARHAMTRNELLPLRPHMPHPHDNKFDKSVQFLKRRLRAQGLTYAVLFPNTRYKNIEKENLDKEAEALSHAIQEGKNSAAFQSAAFLMKKLKEHY